VARLLDEAEEVINTAGPQILAEVEAERGRRKPKRSGGSRRWGWFRRR
jgi:hypothetical protein